MPDKYADAGKLARAHRGYLYHILMPDQLNSTANRTRYVAICGFKPYGPWRVMPGGIIGMRCRKCAEIAKVPRMPGTVAAV